MSRLDRSLIVGLDVFETVAGEDLDEILRHARARRYERNETVFRQGAEADHFFLLVDGHLKVTQATPDGQQVVVRFVNPGELFGIAAAIGRRDFPGTATAAAESIALSWSAAYWPVLVARHPVVGVNALKIVGARLQEQHTRLQEVATQRVERRLAHVLLRLVRQAGRKAEGRIDIDFPVSRQDLAEMTAATLFTVSRIMSAWEQAGIVDSGRQQIAVRDPHALVQIAEGDG